MSPISVQGKTNRENNNNRIRTLLINFFGAAISITAFYVDLLHSNNIPRAIAINSRDLGITNCLHELKFIRDTGGGHVHLNVLGGDSNDFVAPKWRKGNLQLLKKIPIFEANNG